MPGGLLCVLRIWWHDAALYGTRKRQNIVPTVGSGKGTTCGSLVGVNELTVTQLVWVSEGIS